METSETRNTLAVHTVHVPYSGKLSREKTFVVCGYLQKFSPQNLGAWCLLAW